MTDTKPDDVAAVLEEIAGMESLRDVAAREHEEARIADSVRRAAR